MSVERSRYCCQDEERRAAVALNGTLNGIDFLEVVDQEVLAAGAPESLRQRLLLVVLLQPVPNDLAVIGGNGQRVRLAGGVRRHVGVRWAAPLNALPAAQADVVLAEELDFLQNDLLPPAPPGRVLVVATDSTGDHSPYTLRLIGADEQLPPTNFDARLSEICFSFKVECLSPLDCWQDEPCPPESFDDGTLDPDYLAKDYPSFRRLMLDRLRTLAPDWQERNPADLGVTLVEILAYAADHLSYYQDAAGATEAYLDTARRRISVRRHARLVDYFLDEGANARTWVHVVVDQDVTLPASTQLLPAAAPSEPSDVQSTVLDTSVLPSVLEATLEQAPAIFETLHEAHFVPGHNELLFYTWSDRECCLPAGSTRATLVGSRLPAGNEPPFASIAPDLEVGAFLLFEEVIGPHTGASADADPAHRHVVRLTSVEAAVDPLNGQPVVEIAWNSEDALPFALCISGYSDAAHGALYLEDVSVARGNLVLADHGRSIEGELVGPIPSAAVDGADDPAVLHDWPFRPRLEHGPLTHAVALPDGFLVAGTATSSAGTSSAAASSATRLLRSDQSAEPRLELIEVNSGERWTPRRDLLAAGRFDRVFVAEIEDPVLAEAGADFSRTRLRFGDGEHGQRPRRGLAFHANYRIGQGVSGNLGADALSRVVTSQPGILGLRNPLPATGGRSAEPEVEARRKAPYAFRVQQRAITADDYARIAERHPEVARAAATFRWTGSWYTVFVTVDREAGRPVDAAFRHQLRSFLEPYRLVGHDLEIDAPRMVPLLLDLFVCLRSGYQRSDVERELRRSLGRGAYFHPDRWTFGQDVHLSPILAAVAAIDGIASVEPRAFHRLDRRAERELELGVLPISRLEIARLDQDTNFLERGRLELHFGGER